MCFFLTLGGPVFKDAFSDGLLSELVIVVPFDKDVVFIRFDSTVEDEGEDACHVAFLRFVWDVESDEFRSIVFRVADDGVNILLIEKGEDLVHVGQVGCFRGGCKESVVDDLEVLGIGFWQRWLLWHETHSYITIYKRMIYVAFSLKAKKLKLATKFLVMMPILG